MGDMADDGEVVRDEQIGQAELFLQVLQQVDDLALQRDVERRNRFVGNDQAGVRADGARDADALALAAGELARVAGGGVGRQPDAVEQFGDAGLHRSPGRGQAVHAQGFGDDLADGHARVQRGVGVLKYDLHVAPAAAQGGGGESAQVLAVEADAAGGGLQQAQREAGGGGFATAGLADQGEGFAWGDVKRDAVHRADASGEMLGQVLDVEQCGHGLANPVCFQQAADWLGDSAISGGTCSVQIGRASAQRGAKRQPGGKRVGGGTLPGIW